MQDKKITNNRSGSKTVSKYKSLKTNVKKTTDSKSDKTDKISDINDIDKILSLANGSVDINSKKNVSSETIVSEYNETIKFLKDNKISISTITLDCKLHTLVDANKFAEHVVLSEDGVMSVKYGNKNDVATNRTIITTKAKKKPSERNFFNQVTILMKPTNKPENGYINIKVFLNGSLQMTGCKDMEDFTNVTRTLVNILKEGYYEKNSKGKTVKKMYISSPEKIGIYDVKIRMINSNFRLDYKVDRKMLFTLLSRNHNETTRDKEIGYVECKYRPTNGHSCVNIKFKYDERSKPSIFVFQTGAVIITGAKNLKQIIHAYHFIQKILNYYFDSIRIVELDINKVNKVIDNYFNNRLTVQV